MYNFSLRLKYKLLNCLHRILFFSLKMCTKMQLEQRFKKPHKPNAFYSQSKPGNPNHLGTSDDSYSDRPQKVGCHIQQFKSWHQCKFPVTLLNVGTFKNNNSVEWDIQTDQLKNPVFNGHKLIDEAY